MIRRLLARMGMRLKRWDQRHIWGQDMLHPEVDRCLLCSAIRKHPAP